MVLKNVILEILKYYEEYFRFSIPIFYTSTNRGCKIYSHCSKNYAIVCLVKNYVWLLNYIIKIFKIIVKLDMNTVILYNTSIRVCG